MSWRVLFGGRWILLIGLVLGLLLTNGSLSQATSPADWSCTDSPLQCTFLGNVGVGTANPIAKLTIRDDRTVEYGLRVDKVATGGNSQAVSAVNSAAPASGYFSHGGFFQADGNGPGNKVGVRGQATGSGKQNIGGYFVASGGTDNYGVYVADGESYFADKVGIRTTDISNVLTVLRNSPTDPIADAWTVYSSQEYKQDIRELTSQEYQRALEMLLSTRLVHFHYKDQGPDAKDKIGVLAEEAPQAILAEGDAKAVSLSEYTSLLHAALVAQQSQIDALKQEIARLTQLLEQYAK